MDFKEMRRQKFLSESHAKNYLSTLNERIQTFKNEFNDNSNDDDLKGEFAWKVASDSLKLILLNYTSGNPVEEQALALPKLIKAFDQFIPFDNPSPAEAHTLTITQQEAYVYVMWLLALCQLLGHSYLVPVVLSWLDQQAEFNRGRDSLFEFVVLKLIGSNVDPGTRVLLHPEAYRPLARAVVADTPEAQSAYVKEFLEGWYKNMKPCYWHGTHSDGSNSYFGYWALEAALVTYLWGIDDSSYRDHLVYPKDLVDFAREHFPYKGPINPDEIGYRARCPGGLACPRSGYWFTPAKADSRQYFEQGQVLPEFSSDYGDTVWQWDENQT